MIDAHLPEIFLTLMGLAVLLYAILDGYDLGVGMLMPFHHEAHRDVMISSIGPFWDANETWLVLAVGLLLIAFPFANSVVFSALYFPTFLLLLGLILRGVSFDFRAKAHAQHKDRWDLLFRLGSWLAALSQGYMLGRWVLGFEPGLFAHGFAVLSALCVSAAYAYIGGAWLVMKTEGEVQRHAAAAGRRAGWLAALGMVAISVINPLLSQSVAERWLSVPEVFLLAPVPLMCLLILVAVDRYLAHVPTQNDIGNWFPFVAVTLLFVLNFLGLAYSYFPDVIPGVMTAAEGASSPAALKIILLGTVFVLPFILAYTALAYYIFRGKTRELTYN
ncbi:cytochrome d ubiquinol oxidase subunit II [Reinekea blandensis]|uniref:Quinol oxidase, subunit II n=1 Tax=Reinekea blandensis MED297 TaxID=314283 RepID=A4BAZ5_9GAMM|nr:cytochrome d ubiquinol oxidase subunit II [Reinekea blandensis]EAR10608.1 quinol oxidase, subunit II [Reinekea sp. MED297] [Reinekea blandensis MED297]